MISLENKKIVVTGASGFIGEHICSRLIGEGAEVYGVCRNQREIDATGITWRFGDLCDLVFVTELLADVKPEIIFHLASHVVGHRELPAVQPTFHANLHGAVNLLTAATEIGCERLILVGSQEEPDLSESSHAVPSSPYAAAKWAASSYARMCHALYQTPVAIARVFMVYGPGQKDIKKLVPYTILSLLKGQAPNLTSGERPVDWIFVEDVADGLLAMAKAENLEGKTVDLGSGSFVTVRQIVETIADLIDSESRPQFGSVATRAMEQVRKARSRETEDLMGWHARTSITKGLEATIEWYRTHPDGKS